MVNIFSENTTMKLEINYMKKKTGRNTNIRTLNNMLLNNQQVNKKIKIYLETNENGNTPLKSMLYSVLSRVQIFATPRSVSHQTPLSSTVSWSLLKFMFIELVMLSNYVILCYPLLLPSIFPSTRVFPSESVFRIRWLKY